MTPEQIKALYYKEVNNADFTKKYGATKQQVYNLRHRTKKIGSMLEILYTIGAIKITKA